MLKIVEIHTSLRTSGEYVVLQNQGLHTVSLAGWALCTDTYLCGSAEEASTKMFVFHDDVPIKPYARVVLFTGRGQSGWCATNDGKQAFVAYWGKDESVWRDATHVHLLQIAASKRVVLPDAEIEYMSAHT